MPRKVKLMLKPVSEQTIVITGASSGIGLATAKLAAQKGARVVLAARNEAALDHAVRTIREEGGEAIYVVTDVSIFKDMENLRDEAVKTFGGINTWVNNAGASLYGYLTETPLEEEQQLFETNFWGVRHGCRVAIPELTKDGGVIINLGSEVSGRAVPLQGIYSATKHAIKAYTDALRMELEKKGIPVAVSLVRPSGINTPFTEHARNELHDGAPSLPPPVYHTNVVAEAIVKCAETPRRDVYVGAPARFFTVLDAIAPRLTDYYMEAVLFDQQSRGNAVPHIPSNENLIHPPQKEGRESGTYTGRVLRRSWYTKLTS